MAVFIRKNPALDGLYICAYEDPKTGASKEIRIEGRSAYEVKDKAEVEFLRNVLKFLKLIQIRRFKMRLLSRC